MFAAGVASLWWMAALASVMFYEKMGRKGERVVPVVGLLLITLAGPVFAHPAWLPAVFE
jgi:predicted metal-binding membrane protein